MVNFAVLKGDAMKINAVLWLLWAGFMGASCAGRDVLQRDAANEIKYGIAYCLGRAYPDSAFSSDARYVAGAYIEKGSADFDAYAAIRAYVDAYREKPYLSKHGRNLAVMQCIDLVTSDEFKDLVEKTIPGPSGSRRE